MTLTDEQFDALYDALHLANSGWNDEDVERLVLLEAKAWEVVESIQKIRREEG